MAEQQKQTPKTLSEKPQSMDIDKETSPPKEKELEPGIYYPKEAMKNVGGTLLHKLATRCIEDDNAEVKGEELEKQLAETIQKFVKEGGDINAIDENRNTALDLASRNGDPLLVKLLITAGAKIAAEGTILHELATCRIREAKAKEVQKQLKEQIQWMILHINAIDKRDNTALSLALSNENPLMAKLLIAAGAHPSLHIGNEALWNGFLVKCQDTLQEKEDFLTHTDSSGRTILHRWANATYPSSNSRIVYQNLLNAFIKAEVDVHAKDTFGLSALDLAKARKNSSMETVLKAVPKKAMAVQEVKRSQETDSMVKAFIEETERALATMTMHPPMEDVTTPQAATSSSVSSSMRPSAEQSREDSAPLEKTKAKKAKITLNPASATSSFMHHGPGPDTAHLPTAGGGRRPATSIPGPQPK